MIKNDKTIRLFFGACQFKKRGPLYFYRGLTSLAKVLQRKKSRHPMLADGNEMINKLVDYSSLKEKGKMKTIGCH